jgi:hypothetical protein
VGIFSSSPKETENCGLCRLTGLSGCIETQHQEAHLFRSEDLAHHLGDLSTHLCGVGAATAAAVRLARRLE